MILRLLARGRTGRRTAIPARTVETPRRSSVNLFKGHTTSQGRAELRRIGSNLNQVVRHLHQGRNDREDLAALQSLVEEVRDQVTLEVARP